jgi:hypothetical protein
MAERSKLEIRMRKIDELIERGMRAVLAVLGKSLSR